MHYSTSKLMLELAFLNLKEKGFLYESKEFYKELRKNVLKDFLKQEWYWDKKQTINAIKEWISKEMLELRDDDILTFKFTQVARKTDFYITSIE